MRKLFLLCFLFVASAVSYGKIVEIQNFNEIRTHLGTETLIILDIDDTLLIPAQMLGCDEWFQKRWLHYQGKGLSNSDSLEKSLAEWEAVRHLTKMQIVESGTEEIVQKLQDQGYTVMGLTTQGLALATRTRQQLLEHRIDFTRSSPSADDQYFIIGGHGVLFRAGILYTSGRHKGESLFCFLEKVGYAPKRILFINDKYSHLLSIEETAKEKGVEFVGLRYAYSDAKKSVFDENVAHYQFTNSTFTNIISDEEARKQLISKEFNEQIVSVSNQ